MVEHAAPEVKEREPVKGTLFITGGSYGIGAEILRQVGPKYPNVVNFDVAESGENDVRDSERVNSVIENSLSSGQVQNDLVVCAGVFRPIEFIEQAPEDIDFVLDVNLKGALHTIQSFLRWHQEQNHQIMPNIVIISSISAFHHGGTKNVVYDSSKAALSYLVRNLANYNCVVNAIEPGTIRGTKIGSWTPNFGIDEELRTLIEQGQASDVEMLGREVTASDIAKVTEMLLFGNKNGAINGTTITVDGGLTAFRKRF